MVGTIRLARLGIQFAGGGVSRVALNKLSCTDQKAMPDRFPRPRINGIDVAKLEPRELGRIDDFDGQMWGSAAFCRYAINQLSVNLP
jgi:hypothetical protein